MIVFWDVVPSRLVDIGWRFRGAYCLHNQGSNLQTRRRENFKSHQLQVFIQKYLLHFVSCYCTG
jgi:hypothetical protein